MHLTPFLLTLTSLLTPAATQQYQQQHQQQPPSTNDASTTQATLNKLTLRIPSSPPHLPNPHLLPASTRATLTTLGHTTLSAPLSDTNTFVFRNVSGGSYLLDVHSAGFVFVPLRVDVTDRKNTNAVGGGGEAGKGKGGAVGGSSSGLGVRAWETFRGNDWANVGERVGVVEGGDGEGSVLLDVRVVGGKGYFMERSSFSVMGIFKNPVILLSMVSMAIFFGMPKMVENMDPETRAEWEERQKESPMNAIMGAASGQNSNPMGNFDMAAFLAGSGGNKGDEGSGGNNGNGKGKGEGKKRR